jgi:hypothetical protein
MYEKIPGLTYCGRFNPGGKLLEFVDKVYWPKTKNSDDEGKPLYTMRRWLEDTEDKDGRDALLSFPYSLAKMV